MAKAQLTLLLLQARGPTTKLSMYLLTSFRQVCLLLKHLCYYNFVAFCSVLLGPQPFYIISDMDLVKEITVKHFDKFVDRMVSSTSVCTP